MELFRSTNIDWLGKKWYFLGFSLIFSVAGVLSMLFWHGIPKGVDFTGGTQIRVAFDQTPNEDHIRQAMNKAGVHDARIQRVSDPSGHAANKVIIALPIISATDQAHDAGRQAVESALAANYHDSKATIEQVEIVGPTAGKQLQNQALLATIYSLIGMLIYLWFRFELIYGVAAVVAVFHDTLITIGAFSLDEPGDYPYGDRGDPDPDRLFDERHDRYLRPHPRKPCGSRRESLARRGEPVDQPDAEPNRVDVGTDLSDGAVACISLAARYFTASRSRWWWAF